jgi:hypothetical protein
VKATENEKPDPYKPYKICNRSTLDRYRYE